MNIKKLFTGLAAFAVVATSLAVAVPSASAQINDPEFDLALAWAYDSGLTMFNTQAGFNPNGLLTREQVARFVSMWGSTNLCLPASATAACSFSDVATADYTLVPYVEAACQMGLVRGFDGMYGYTNNVTKAEFTTMLSRAISAAAGEMAPTEDVEPWWSNHFNAMRALGVTRETSAWDLDKFVTRYEALLMLYRSRVESAECGDDALDITDILNDLFGDDDDAVVDTDDSTAPDGTVDVSAVSAGTLTGRLSATTPNGATVPGNVSLVAATYEFTAQTEDVVLTSVQLERRGLGNNPVVNNVVIFADGQVVSRARSFSSSDRVANVNLNPAVVVRAGQTVKLEAVVKVGSESVASNQEFQIAMTGFESNGTNNTSALPASGNVFKVAGLNGAQVLVRDDGSVPDVELGDMEATVARFEIENTENDAVYITSVTLTDDQRNADKNLNNFKLVANGEVLATTANASRRNVTFNLATPFKIEDNQRQSFRVHADVIAGAGDSIKFDIDQEVFVRGYDERFGYGLSVDLSSFNAQSFTINAGQVTLARQSVDSLRVVSDRRDTQLAVFNINVNAGKDLSLEDISFTVAQPTVGLTTHLANHFDDIKLFVTVNGVRRSYDMFVSSSTTGSFVAGDTDLSVFLPENADIKVELVADTIRSSFPSSSINERFRVSLNANNLRIIENNDDEDVGNISPSSISFETLTFTESDPDILSLNLTNVDVVKGSQDVDFIRFAVEADNVSDVFVQGFEIVGAVTSGSASFDNNLVDYVRLFKVVPGGWELLQDESAFRISGNRIVLDRFGDVRVPRNTTQTFFATVGVVDNSANIDVEFTGTLIGARIVDDRNKRLRSLGDTPALNINSGRTIRVADAGELDILQVTDAPVDRDLHVVAGTTSPVLAAFELIAVNEAVRIERARLNVTTSSGNFQGAVSEVVIFDEDMVTELYRRPVSSNTVVAMNDFNQVIPQGSRTLYVSVVTNRIGQAFNGNELQDVQFTFEVDEAFGVSSDEEIVVTPVTHPSVFDVLAVHLSDVVIRGEAGYLGTISNTALTNGQNILGVIELTANTWTNTDSGNNANLRAVLDNLEFDLNLLGGAAVATGSGIPTGIQLERMDISPTNRICDATTTTTLSGGWAVDFSSCSTQVRELTSGTTARFRVIVNLGGVVNGSSAQIIIGDLVGGYITYSSTDGSTASVTEMRLGKSDVRGTNKTRQSN